MKSAPECEDLAVLPNTSIITRTLTDRLELGIGVLREACLLLYLDFHIIQPRVVHHKGLGSILKLNDFGIFELVVDYRSEVSFLDLDALRTPFDSVSDEDVVLRAARVHDIWEVASLVRVKTVSLTTTIHGTDGKDEMRGEGGVRQIKRFLNEEHVSSCIEYNSGRDAPLHSTNMETRIFAGKSRSQRKGIVPPRGIDPLPIRYRSN